MGKQLERMMIVFKWEIMAVDEILIHLSSKQSDATMYRAAMEILAGPNPSLEAP